MGVAPRSQRVAKRNTFLLSQVGLHQYGSEVFGLLRAAEEDTTKGWWHDAPQHPGTPLRRPPLRWPFLTDLDVSGNTWTISNSGTGTPLAVEDRHRGFAVSTNAATDNAYYFYESKSEFAQLIQGRRHVYFITEIAIDDVDEADFFIGLSARLGSGNLFDDRVDCIGFYLEDGSGSFGIECSKDGTPTQTPDQGLLVDGTDAELQFVVTGQRRVDFYLNNRWLTGITTTIPDDELLGLAFGLRNGQAAANAFHISTTTVLID